LTQSIGAVYVAHKSEKRSPAEAGLVKPRGDQRHRAPLREVKRGTANRPGAI